MHLRAPNVIEKLRSLTESSVDRLPQAELLEVCRMAEAYENVRFQELRIVQVRRSLLEYYRRQFAEIGSRFEKYRDYFPGSAPPCSAELAEAARTARPALPDSGALIPWLESASSGIVNSLLEYAAGQRWTYTQFKTTLAERLSDLAEWQAPYIVHQETKKKKPQPDAGSVADQASKTLADQTAEVLHRAAILASKQLAVEDGASDQDAYDAIDELELQDIFDDLADSAGTTLQPVLEHHGQAALADLKIDAKNIVDLVNGDAAFYAKARGAELVGRKWVDGKLVDNPDPAWAITQTTRDGLKDLLVKGYEDGWIPAQLKKEIVNAYDFSPERAEMIARTETRKASMQGTLYGWRESGVVRGKLWLLSGDHDDDDECDDNADAGEVALDDDFPDGSDGPPAHPNCNCSMSAVLDTDDGEEADETRETSAGAVAAWVTRKANASNFGGAAKELGYDKVAAGKWQHPLTGHQVAADSHGWRHMDGKGSELASGSNARQLHTHLMRTHQMSLFAAGEADDSKAAKDDAGKGGKAGDEDSDAADKGEQGEEGEEKPEQQSLAQNHDYLTQRGWTFVRNLPFGDLTVSVYQGDGGKLLVVAPNGGIVTQTGEAGTSDGAKKAWDSRQRAQKTEPAIRLKKAERTYIGRPMDTKSKMTKIETGRVAEAVVLAYMHSQGLKDAAHMNNAAANYPVDLLQDHTLIEVKGAQVSNSRGKMWWGATLGEPSAKEKAWLETASPEEKREHNDKKRQEVLDRKNQALKDVGKLLGRKITPHTYTAILNPDTKTADLYHFPGFHLYIGFNSQQAKEGYIGSVKWA